MNKLLTGLAIGVAVGLLIAPDKGSETRRKITEKGRDLKDKFNEFVDSLGDKIDALRGDAEEFIDEARPASYPV
jgi:gas vesicle protein